MNDLRRLQAALNEAMKPFVQLKVDILNVSLPTIRLFPDGHVETFYSPEVEAQLAKIEALWQEEADHIHRLCMDEQCGYREPIR